MRHPSVLAAAAAIANIAAAVSIWNELLREDYSPVLEQDGRFALDAPGARGMQLLQEF